MKRATFLFLALVSVGWNTAPAQIGQLVLQASAQTTQASSPAPAPATGQGTLRWKNGESLTGVMVAASPDTVTWNSPDFGNPLQLRWNVVERIEWPQADVAPASPFGIVLRDGSFIYGDLASITGNSISIHSTRHGDVTLKRSEVLSVRRLKGGSLVYSGPLGDQGWTAMSNQPDGNVLRSSPPQTLTPPLATGPGGSLLIRNWNRTAMADITLPDSFDVELRVTSSKRPEFLLSFGGNVLNAMCLETWDNQLVLTDGDQFQVVRKIEDNEREVDLRVLWDKTAQKCWVYTPTGDLITSWELPASGDAAKPAPQPPAASVIIRGGGALNQRIVRMQINGMPTFTLAGRDGTARTRPNLAGAMIPGMVLQNRGLDLALELLRVSKWDGKLPARSSATHSRIELTDGRTISGEIASAHAGNVDVSAAGQSAPTSYPIANVDALFFSSDSPQESAHAMTLLYNDGTMIHGTIDSLANGHAAITTSFTDKPLMSSLDQLQQLAIRMPAPKTATPEPPLDSMDKIVIEQTTLHGKLTGAKDGSVRWMPIGGIQPVTPSTALSTEITRSFFQGAPAQDLPPPSDPALFYLNSGDVVPGTLESIDRTGVDIKSSIMDPRKLPANMIEAIQFPPPTPLSVQGFSDPGWKIVKGTDKTVRRSNGNLEMDGGTSILLPTAMQSSEIRFKMASNGLSSARLRMFSAEGDNSHSLDLLIGDTGNQFIVGTESTPGQFDNQNQLMTKPGDAVSICIKVEENKLEFLANDVTLQEIPLEPAKYGGSGLAIEPAGLWGNNTFTVSLSDFSAKTVPGRSWLPEVTADIKNQILTVPRFDKDDPPKHVLLAPNGDVLRGEVEAATDSHFGFRSGLEELTVPRERVRAVIWLKPPDANASPAPAQAVASGPLQGRIQMRIMFGGAPLNQYMSFIQSQVPGVKYRLADNLNNNNNARLVQMQIGNQTVAEALDAICERFDVHYRLDPDGTIIMESQVQQSTPDLGLKCYWLKPGTFPDKPSPQEVLTAKGLTFSKEASARWQSASGLLSMVNTADNQAKLAALVGTDYGGSLGSPNYWLQLTSGGRIPLAVDHFGDDFITGQNPAYGAVKIPTTELYSLRTSPPEPSITTKSLENWQLVNAPEPVIPEGGGESSPLLGKAAETFSLPLLAGGNFDLSAEKGHVIVLDFWATWCGPCIKSLPGLIDTLASFPTDKVKLIGVNQGEAPEQIKHFLAAKGLKLNVAMDSDQDVGRKYGVDAIPQTIIVGPDGKVAWSQTGYDPDGESAAADTIKHLLGTASPADPPSPAATQ
jgi:peroxiredoxin